MKLPKISVLVPVYNVENYVSKCIESIINQNYKNLEIIIINDGSTDKGGKICEYYVKKDSRIILINQENKGLAVARNNALDISSGDYVGFVDSDDWIELDMYYTLYNNSIAFEADISSCNFKHVSEKKGDSFPYADESSEILVLNDFDKIVYNVNTCNNCVWNKLFKRRLFDNIRFPEGKLFEDIFTMHKLIELANRVVFSFKCKYNYLLRDGGITLSKFNIKQLDIIEAFIERHTYISNKYPDLEKKCRKAIFQRLLWCMSKAYAITMKLAELVQ